MEFTAWLLVLPFLSLLVMIATGPLLYHHFWERYYPLVALGLALLVSGIYVFEGNHLVIIHTLVEYIQFIALVAVLYVVAGGILIRIDRQATPLMNVLFLWIGAMTSNVVGTTGASILLIRPYIHLNKGRIAPYHIAFFIFMVSNVGEVLTPIADPPLVLGFLKGVPFLWTLRHGLLPWLLALALLSFLFYWLDQAHQLNSRRVLNTSQGGIKIEGKKWVAFCLDYWSDVSRS